MSDNVGRPTPSFTQIRQEYEPGFLGIGSTEHLRGNQTGVYLHSMFSISNWGEEALLERQQKWAQGAEIVRQSIDSEFGPGVGDQIFQKVSQDTGRDLSKELFRGDLPLLKAAIDEALQPVVIGNLGDGGSTPLKTGLNENQISQAKIFGIGETGEPGTVERPPQVMKTLTAMFKRGLSDDDIRGLGGIPDRCNVSLELVQLDPRIHRNPDTTMPGVLISKKGADPSGAFNRIQMTVYRDQSGKVNIYRDSTLTNTSPRIGDQLMRRPTNLGACALVRQVDTARALGVNTIHNFATQGKGYNGYYTWARCGGNAPLTGNAINIVEENDIPRAGMTNLREEDEPRYQNFVAALKESDNKTIQMLAQKRDLDVQDFMATEEGRKFWRDNGFPIPLEFDLTKGSKTMTTFQGYTLPNSCYDLR